MTKMNERVFIRGARLSYPALDKPRASSFDTAGADPRYQATFLMEPNSPSVKALWAAITKVAQAEFGPAGAPRVLNSPDKHPLKKGDDKEVIPDGYAGMIYLSAKSKNAPELRDANPRILITDEQTIREKFVAGYYVNGYVDIYPYTVKAPSGAVLKSGIAASLVSVQFCRYGDAFSGAAKPAESDYPDCTAEAEASSTAAYGATYGGDPAPSFPPTPSPAVAPSPAQPVANAAEPPMADDGLPF